MKLLIIIICLIGVLPKSYSQCWTSTVPYNTNFNWTLRGLAHPVCFGPNQNSADLDVELPYFADVPNGYNVGQPNIIRLHATNPNQDIRSDDGWVVLRKNFGNINPNGTGSPDPYFILYNKYTGRMKLFMGQKGTLKESYMVLRTKFTDVHNTNNLRTALLNFNAPIVKTLEEFDPDMQVNTINQHWAQTPGDKNIFWYYSDYMTAYDPCGCIISNNNLQQNITLEIEKMGYTVTEIKAKISGTINQIVDDKNQAQPGSSGFNLGKTIKAGIKGYETYQGFASKGQSIFDKLHSKYKDKVIKEYFSAELAPLYKQNGWQPWEVDAEFNKFKSSPESFKKMIGLGKIDKYSNIAGAVKGIASAIPYVGTAIGVFDALFGGDGGATAPPPLNFEVDLSLSGDLKTTTYYPAGSFRLPGAITSIGAGYTPIYDNTLGILNMTEPPKFEYALIKPLNVERPEHIDETCCAEQAQGPGSGYFDNVIMKNYMYQYRIKQLPKIVVNPHSNLEIETIDAAIILDYKRSDSIHLRDKSRLDLNYVKFFGNKSGYNKETTISYKTMKKIPFYPKVFSTDKVDEIVEDIEKTNELELEYINKDYDTEFQTGILRFRTPYVPLQCLRDLTFTLIGGGATPSTYIKVLIKLKRKDLPSQSYSQILTFDASGALLSAEKHSNEGTYTPVVWGTNCYYTCIPFTNECLSSGCDDMNYGEFKNIVRPWANPLSVVRDGLKTPIWVDNSTPSPIYVKGNVEVFSDVSNKTIYATGKINLRTGIKVSNCNFYAPIIEEGPDVIVNPNNLHTGYLSSYADFLGCNKPLSDVIATEADIYGANGICNRSKYKGSAGYFKSAQQHSPPKSKSDFFTTFSLHPNPSTSLTTLTIQNPSSEQASVRVYDLVGREVYSQDMKDVSASNNKVEISTDGWQTGLYIVKVIHGEVEKSIKLEVR